jgi:hypothetical protein
VDSGAALDLASGGIHFGAPGLGERLFLTAELGWLALALTSVKMVDQP